MFLITNIFTLHKNSWKENAFMTSKSLLKSKRYQGGFFLWFCIHLLPLSAFDTGIRPYNHKTLNNFCMEFSPPWVTQTGTTKQEQYIFKLSQDILNHKKLISQWSDNHFCTRCLQNSSAIQLITDDVLKDITYMMGE